MIGCLTEKILLGIGLFLFVFNLTGFFIPWRNENIRQELPNNKVLLNAETAIGQLHSLSTDDPDFLELATSTVHYSMVHYWEDENAADYRVIVPANKNYILWSLGKLFPESMRKYEFKTYEPAITRGVGLCSQFSIALSDYLESRGIKNDIVGLDGHVVVQAKNDNGTYSTLDPDFNVVMPMGIDTIESDPSMIEPYYEQREIEAAEIKRIVSAFSYPNTITTGGVRGYYPKSYWISTASWILIWMIPAAFCTLSFTLYRQRKRKLSKSNSGRTTFSKVNNETCD